MFAPLINTAVSTRKRFVCPFVCPTFKLLTPLMTNQHSSPLAQMLSEAVNACVPCRDHSMACLCFGRASARTKADGQKAASQAAHMRKCSADIFEELAALRADGLVPAPSLSSTSSAVPRAKRGKARMHEDELLQMHTTSTSAGQHHLVPDTSSFFEQLRQDGLIPSGPGMCSCASVSFGQSSFEPAG